MKRQRYKRRQSRSAVWALRCGLFSFVILVLAYLLHRFWTLQTPDLVLIAAVSCFLALFALICGAKGFLNLWRNGDKGGARSFLGGFFAILTLLPCAAVLAYWWESPAIFDVSTDFQTPPQFDQNMPKRLAEMNQLTRNVQGENLAQIAAYPNVVGHRYDAAPDRVADGVQVILQSYGWPVIVRGKHDADQNITEFVATAYSPIWGLKSDVVIRLMDEGEATFVDMRSVSQYGKRDFGLNAAFITQFLADLTNEVNKAPANIE